MDSAWAWPLAMVTSVVIVMLVGSLGTPATRRHKIQVEELRARGNEEYRALADKYEALAKQSNDALATMRADCAALRETVDSIERMMREVS